MGSTIDILDYVNGIGNGSRELNHPVQTRASRQCRSSLRLAGAIV